MGNWSINDNYIEKWESNRLIFNSYSDTYIYMNLYIYI